jgi:hypothetical protein
MGIARNIARLVPNGSGLLPNANIEAVAASKLTGQVPDANAPSGSVIQVVSATKTDTFSVSNSSWVDIPGLSVSITPSNTNNKILIAINCHVDSTVGMYTSSIRILRNGSAIGVGDANGTSKRTFGMATSNLQAGPGQGDCIAGTFLDSPATTSAITYKLQLIPYATNGGESYLNRGYSNNGGTEQSTAISTITVMEIAA